MMNNNMLLRLFVAVLCLGGLTPAMAQKVTKTYRIEQMHCDHCAHKVMVALTKNNTVEDVEFNLDRRTATMTYDASKVNLDSLQSALTGTRYKLAAYDPQEVIARKKGFRIDDMHCQKCADRITAKLSEVAGVDSVVPHLDEHWVAVSYDANRISRDSIQSRLLSVGYTPVGYSASEKISYAYLTLPKDADAEATRDAALALDYVADASVSTRRHALAVSYKNADVTEEKLVADLQKAGVNCQVPPPHECKEEK